MTSQKQFEVQQEIAKELGAIINPFIQLMGELITEGEESVDILTEGVSNAGASPESLQVLAAAGTIEVHSAISEMHKSILALMAIQMVQVGMQLTELGNWADEG